MNAILVAPPRRDFDEVPPELKALKKWVIWRFEQRGDNVTKRPLQSVADPGAWLAFDQACVAYLFGEADGVGIVLGDGLVGIDLDRCFGPAETPHPIAVDALALETYVERSPSRRGLHVLISGSIERPRNIRATDGPGREIYDGGRYFTVTGDRISNSGEIASGPEAQAKLDAFIRKWFPEPTPLNDATTTPVAGSPSPLADDVRVLQLLFAAKNGAKAKRLHDGDSRDYPSASEGDYALVRCVRFYTQDPEQIDRIFRASKRMRDKVVVHPTYLRDTIAKALRAGGKVYRPESEAARVARLLERQANAKASIPLWTTTYLAKVGAVPVLVLLVIAAYADAHGNASPSIATIAWHLGIDESLVCRGIKMLEGAGVLRHDRQFNAENNYHVARKRPDAQVTRFAPKERAKPIAERVKAPDSDGAKGLTSDECLTTVINTEREDIYLL